MSEYHLLFVLRSNNFSICQNKNDSSPPPLSSQQESSTIKDLHTSSTKFDFIFSIGKVPGKLQSQSREVTKQKHLAPNFLSALKMSWCISMTQPLQPFCSWMQISSSDLYTCFLQVMPSPPISQPSSFAARWPWPDTDRQHGNATSHWTA